MKAIVKKISHFAGPNEKFDPELYVRMIGKSIGNAKIVDAWNASDTEMVFTIEVDIDSELFSTNLLSKVSVIPADNIVCGYGHPTRERKQGEWMLSCGCVALDATNDAIRTHVGGWFGVEEYREHIKSLGESPN